MSAKPPAKPKLTVSLRKTSGRKVKALRREGLVPGNIFGKGIKSISIQLPLKQLKTVFTQVGETGILELQVEKETKTRPALINQLQTHPVTDEILHVDFRQVDLSQKITVNIPIEIIGEAPAINKGGVLIHLMNEIEVEALPEDLPEKFTLDVSQLEEIGQGISVKEIKVDPGKVKIMVDNPDELVVKIEEPTKEEEKPVEAAPGEPETTATPTETTPDLQPETEKKEPVKEEKK